MARGRPAPPWTQVKLRVAFGDVPPFGAVLVVRRTQRAYQVVGVRGRQLQCLVLPDGEVGRIAASEPDTPVWWWEWSSRRKTPAKHGGMGS